MGLLLLSKRKPKIQERFEDEGSEGFTLVELLMSLAIMGMILFVINVILISVLKSSARTDTSVRMRRQIETGFEVIERNVKSASPSSICIARRSQNDVWECTNEISGDAVMMTIMSDIKASVVFYREEEEDPIFVLDEKIGVLSSHWIIYTANGSSVDYTADTYLTNLNEMSVEKFEVDLLSESKTGTFQVILRMISDSSDRIGTYNPLVNDMFSTINIVTKGPANL